jgi:hypothetical protein
VYRRPLGTYTKTLPILRAEASTVIEELMVIENNEQREQLCLEAIL